MAVQAMMLMSVVVMAVRTQLLMGVAEMAASA